MGKLGQAGEITFIAVVIFAFIFISVIMSYFLSGFKTTLNDSLGDTSAGAQAVSIVSSGEVHFKESMDNSALIVMGVLIIGGGILALILPTHFIFIVIAFMLMPFITFFAGLLQAVYIEGTNNSVLNITAVQYTNSAIIMNNFPLLILIADAVFIIVMFVKLYAR